MSGINSKVEVLVQVRPINFSKLFSLVQTLLCEDYLLPFANLMSAELQSEGGGVCLGWRYLYLGSNGFAPSLRGSCLIESFLSLALLYQNL